MELNIYQVDAFARRHFEGNPAAVCPLKSWLPDITMQRIAEENNLSETAFFVLRDKIVDLRWFTPVAEVDLCGHATLASAHVLFQHLGYADDVITFMTRSGKLEVSRADEGYLMNFPAMIPQKSDAPAGLLEGLGVQSAEVLSSDDYLVVLESESRLKALEPDFQALMNIDKRGVIVTAPGDDVDFVSRCFFPKLRVNEDPVTGSAHCELTPFWAKRLRKNHLVARQLSKRTGTVTCRLIGDRVELAGTAIDYLSGTIDFETMP